MKDPETGYLPESTTTSTVLSANVEGPIPKMSLEEQKLVESGWFYRPVIIAGGYIGFDHRSSQPDNS